MGTDVGQNLGNNPSGWDKIDHIVVLMFENRSFDNLLGWLYDDEEPRDGQYFEGLESSMWNPLSNVDADGIPFVEQVYVRKNGEAPKHNSIWNYDYGPENFCLPDPDPGEGYRDTNHQLFQKYDVGNVYSPDPTNLGFVDNYKNAMLYGTSTYGDKPTDPREIMACYTNEQTPVLSALATAYAVCDRWHCPVPSQTWPNRAFALAATCDGNVNNRPDWVITTRTIFDQLEAGDTSWKVYAGLQKDADTGEPVPFSLTRIMLPPDKAVDYGPNFVLMDDFYADLEAGTLPAFSFLEPQLSTVTDDGSTDGTVVAKQNDQHPPSDIRDGEQLMADIYNAIVASRYWTDDQNILFVVTYDEHGGCYDHTPPPLATQPIPARFDDDGEPVFVTPEGADEPIPASSDCYPVDPQFGFRFNRYGVRVPTVLISPWVQPGTVARPEAYHDPKMMEPDKTTSKYFDHTSIIASVRNCFGLSGCLTDRDRYAPDLSCVITDEAHTDPVELKPLDVPDAELDADSHLMEAISDHLAGRTGIDRAEGERASDHVARSHKALQFANFKLPPSMQLPMCSACGSTHGKAD